MINKATLVGNVGKDPEFRDIKDNQRVANFTLATSNKSGDKKFTEWHRITVFGKLVDVLEKYVQKGTQLYIEGEIRTRKWEKDGHTNYTTEITVAGPGHTFRILSKGKGNSSDVPADHFGDVGKEPSVAEGPPAL
jgi:single-strand DNA-binding protein